jgi:hypothetical protein
MESSIRGGTGGRGTLHGSGGVFSYQVPTNSLTVVKVAR